MSKRSRDARRQLDDLYGNDQLGQRSSPRQDRDKGAAGRAEQARQKEQKKKTADAQKKLKADAAKRRDAAKKKSGGGGRKGWL